MYRMNKARTFMKRLTPEDKTHYTLKLAASDLFKGQKEAYPGSVARPFLTTHLSMQAARIHTTAIAHQLQSLK
jgi:hypothetical protein